MATNRFPVLSIRMVWDDLGCFRLPDVPVLFPNLGWRSAARAATRTRQRCQSIGSLASGLMTERLSDSLEGSAFIGTDAQVQALGTQKAISLAKAGNETALRLCMERLIAPRRERSARFKLPEKIGISEN